MGFNSMVRLYHLVETTCQLLDQVSITLGGIA